MKVYQRSRDVINAQLTLALMRTMPRMVLWAHHSHLHYNSLGRAVPSMGQHLRSALGDRLYTVGLFANGGNALDSLRADCASGAGIVFALASRAVPASDRFGVERRLAALSSRDFFVDLKQAPAEWERPDFSRLEVDGRMPTALSRDFDGAILLHRVTGAELNFLAPAFRMALRWAGWVLRHPILTALIGLLLLAGLALGIPGLWRRRRARRARRRAQAV
jgi:erythromycin esterase-like protein